MGVVQNIPNLFVFLVENPQLILVILTVDSRCVMIVSILSFQMVLMEGLALTSNLAPKG